MLKMICPYSLLGRLSVGGHLTERRTVPELGRLRLLGRVRLNRVGEVVIVLCCFHDLPIPLIAWFIAKSFIHWRGAAALR